MTTYKNHSKRTLAGLSLICILAGPAQTAAQAADPAGMTSTISGEEACRLHDHETDVIVESIHRKARVVNYSAAGMFAGGLTSLGADAAERAVIKAQGRAIVREASGRAAKITDDIVDALLSRPQLRKSVEALVADVDRNVTRGLAANTFEYLETHPGKIDLYQKGWGDTVARELREALLDHFDKATADSLAPHLDDAITGPNGALRSINMRSLRHMLSQDIHPTSAANSAARVQIALDRIRTVLRYHTAKVLAREDGFMGALTKVAMKHVPAASALRFRAGKKAAGCVKKAGRFAAKLGYIGAAMTSLGIFADLLVWSPIGDATMDTSYLKNPARLLNAKLIHPKNACRKLKEDPVLREKFALMVGIVREERQESEAPVCGGQDERRVSNRTEKAITPAALAPAGSGRSRHATGERAI